MDIVDAVFVLQLREEEKLQWHQRDHSHPTGQMEVHYFIDGGGTFINKNIQYSLSSHVMFVTKGGERHKITTNRESAITYYAVLMQIDDCDSNLIEELSNKGPIKVEDSLRFFFDRIKSLGLSKSKNQRLSACHQLLGLLYNLDSDFPNEIKQSSVKIEKSLKFMTKHLFDPINLKDVADYVELNPYYLDRLFKKEVGITPMKYISNLKIEAAKSMLATTLISIKEIAGKLNYSSSFHFSKAFKDNVKSTPTEYRKTHQQSIGQEISN